MTGQHAQTGAPQQAGASRSAAWWLLLAAGLAMTAAVARWAGVDRAFEACREAGPGVLAILAAPAVGMLMHALGWRALLPPAARPGIPRAWLTYVAAQGIDEVGGGVLGEPLKCLSLPKEHRDVAVAAMALDNIAQMLAFLLFLAGALAALAGTSAAGPVRAGVWATLGVVLAIGGAGLAAVWWRPARFPAWSRVADEVLAGLHRHPGRLVASVAWHLGGKAWIIAEFGLTLAILGPVDPGAAAGLAVVSTAASAIGMPIPGQIGAVEGALVAAGPLFGVAAPVALALALLRRARSLAWIGLGFGCATLLRRKP